MAEQIEDSAEAVSLSAPPRRRILRRVLAILALAVLATLALAWFGREEIADSLIRDQLEKLGLAASYEIESIGPRRQVLVNVVIGDPERPDLTIERVETSLVPRFPLGRIGRIRLVRPRLYGSYVDGQLSFGALDPLLFEQPPEEPLTLPDMDLVLEDGRALIESDYGPAGFKAEGRGNLRDGFSGIFAAVAPRLEHGGCAASRASLYGTVTIDAERPGFAGPLRLASLDCGGAGLAAEGLVLTLDARIDRGLDGLEGTAELAGGHLAYAGNRAGGLAASLRFGWRKNALTASYRLGLDRVETPQLALSSLALEGSARSREGLARVEVEARAEGADLRPGPSADAALARAARAASGTFAGPMLERIRASLAREGRGSTLAADFTLRRTGEVASLVVPDARWKAGGGESLLAVSRFQLTLDSAGQPRFSGNFATGGRGLPRISGRMEGRGGANDARFRLRMAEYRVGNASLALPGLDVTRSGDGGYRFSGALLASGPVPGGSVSGLALPIEGRWSPDGALALWRDCLEAGFERLTLARLDLARRRLRLCPGEGGAILRSGPNGTVLAATSAGLDLAGRLGATPVSIATGALALNYPAASMAQDVEIGLGEAAAPSRFRIGELTLEPEAGPGGRFAHADVLLGAVPLDVLDASGKWSYAGGRLELGDGRFRLRDRVQPGRFNPLVARGAGLVLGDNRITARADLRERRSDRIVTRADIVHDLETGAGHADLTVDGLQFDERLQPDTLTDLALGVVANVHGAVEGSGRIDWSPETLTSSGEFRTDDLDFAAAFGPVEGVSGTIVFTDLLGMVTAPEQVLTIHSFNPGIQVDEGFLTYELRPGYEMVIHGGVWPFIGGTLILEPTTTVLTRTDERRYTLRLIGVDASQFVERMELANIAATGRFDGRVPLVFDQEGGRLEGGYLVSRPPGGNLAYVGALTYEDVSPIANFAFDALRSLDFTRMEVELNGPLAGEIVTRVRFDGIRQGADARRNIVTRQLARLPIRFNVNIRAPFYKLITSIQTMYDPAFVADPRQIGLLDENGNPAGLPAPATPEADRPGGIRQDEEPIQSPDSQEAP